jgi:hypothetical protein
MVAQYRTVKQYSTMVLLDMSVSVSTEPHYLQSLDKRSHNFIFSMLKHYNYPVNPLCAMAAQGMKTVYADPWNTSMWRAFVVPTGRTTMYESCDYLRPSMLPRRCPWHRWVNPRRLQVTMGPPSIIVKAMDTDESYGNTIVLIVLKNELTTTAYEPFHVWTWWMRC